jgi:hypothetical protein
MTQYEDETPVAGGHADPEAVQPQSESLMDRLRRRRAEVADAHTTRIPVPVLSDPDQNFRLKVEHRLMDRTETAKIGNRNRRTAKGDRSEFQYLVLLDVIINSTEGFWYQEGDGEDQPLENGSGQITRWEELAAFVGYDGSPPSARDALTFCFGGNEFAIGDHGFRLNSWFSNTGRDVDEEMLGELRG